MSHRRDSFLRSLLGAAAVAATACVVAAPASAATPSGYQEDQFRLAGPGRLVVTVTAPKQVPGLPASTRGYHEFCGTEASPILRYRIRYSTSGDSFSFGLRGQWARPGSTSFVAFGVPSNAAVEGSSYGAPRAGSWNLTGDDFLNGALGQPTVAIPVAPPAALLDLRVIIRNSYFIPLWGDLGYSVDNDQATLATKLEFRVSTSTTCAVPASYPRYFKAR